MPGEEPCRAPVSWGPDLGAGAVLVSVLLPALGESSSSDICSLGEEEVPRLGAGLAGSPGSWVPAFSSGRHKMEHSS